MVETCSCPSRAAPIFYHTCFDAGQPFSLLSLLNSIRAKPNFIPFSMPFLHSLEGLSFKNLSTTEALPMMEAGPVAA